MRIDGGQGPQYTGGPQQSKAEYAKASINQTLSHVDPNDLAGKKIIAKANGMIEGLDLAKEQGLISSGQHADALDEASWKMKDQKAYDQLDTVLDEVITQHMKQSLFPPGFNIPGLPPGLFPGL
ncbi:MAG: hypothetical protein H7A36_00710 [Chlamydiales bacterium]|nr:hypothetical protein [Chlamydiales bacterium]